MSKKTLSWTLLISCNMMWALQFTCIKLVQDQLGHYFTVWLPMLAATLLLFPFVAKGFKDRGKGFKDILIFMRLALLGAFPAQVLMTWGTQYSLASNAAVLTLCLPAVSALFAYIMLHERMNRIRWTSFAVAITGVLLCSAGQLADVNFNPEYALGNGLIMAAIAGNAYYNTGCKQIADRYTALELVFNTYLVMVVLLTPLVFYYEPEVFSKIPSFTADTWTGLALLTVLHNFLSMILFFRALKSLDAIQVALSNYLITLFGLPIAAIWLGERLSLPMIIGGLLVLVSTVITTTLDRTTDDLNVLKEKITDTL